jgi:hypothetical protein
MIPQKPLTIQERCALRRFLDAEDGAITVDWTVVGAAVVGLGLIGIGAVRSGVVDLGVDIDGSLSGAMVANLGTLGGRTWTFSPLFTNDAGIQNLISQITAWNYNAAQLQQVYDAWVNAAERYIAQGDSRYAGLFVDHLQSISQVLANQGAAPRINHGRVVAPSRRRDVTDAKQVPTLARLAKVAAHWFGQPLLLFRVRALQCAIVTPRWLGQNANYCIESQKDSQIAPSLPLFRHNPG